jgi:hypothetical protein
LVLNDEQHFIVVGGLRKQILGREQPFQPQVIRVGGTARQIDVNRTFELSLVHDGSKPFLPNGSFFQVVAWNGRVLLSSFAGSPKSLDGGSAAGQHQVFD